MTQLDPRLHAFREDLAAVSLKDRVRAPRYSQGEVRQVAAPAAPVRIAPKFDADLATEALSGELLTVYDTRDGWAWVQLSEDGYVGYTPLDCLSTMVEENTHRVSARLTYLYPAPEVKRPPITKLSFSCTVAPIGKLEGGFVELSRGGFIFADHLVGIRDRAKDFVRVAERLVGVPYLWGGKTTLGIDCSGLLQIALQASGVPCPRDSDMQLASAGEPIDPSKLDAIQRGDLLFWRGHVAIAQSPDWMIHASGHHMEVVVEQIRHAVERIAETHGPLLSILRPALEQKKAAERMAPSPQQAPAPRAGEQKPAPSQPAPAAAKEQAAKPVSSGAPAPGAQASPPANPTAENRGGKTPQPAGEKPSAAVPASADNERRERAAGAQQGAVKSPPPGDKSDPPRTPETSKQPAQPRGSAKS